MLNNEKEKSRNEVAPSIPAKGAVVTATTTDTIAPMLMDFKLTYIGFIPRTKHLPIFRANRDVIEKKIREVCESAHVQIRLLDMAEDHVKLVALFPQTLKKQVFVPLFKDETRDALRASNPKLIRADEDLWYTRCMFHKATPSHEEKFKEKIAKIAKRRHKRYADKKRRNAFRYAKK